jgi:hypothetical protein
MISNYKFIAILYITEIITINIRFYVYICDEKYSTVRIVFQIIQLLYNSYLSVTLTIRYNKLISLSSLLSILGLFIVNILQSLTYPVAVTQVLVNFFLYYSLILFWQNSNSGPQNYSYRFGRFLQTLHILFTITVCVLYISYIKVCSPSDLLSIEGLFEFVILGYLWGLSDMNANG